MENFEEELFMNGTGTKVPFMTFYDSDLLLFNESGFADYQVIKNCTDNIGYNLREEHEERDINTSIQETEYL